MLENDEFFLEFHNEFYSFEFNLGIFKKLLNLLFIFYKTSLIDRQFQISDSWHLD